MNKIEKSERGLDGIIKENVTFDCLSLWYEENQAVYVISAGEDEIRWDFKWDSKFVGFSRTSLEFINTGHTEASIELEINGEIENPKILLYIEDELYQEIDFNVRLENHESLLYSSKENNFFIDKINTDGTRTSLFNLDTINFDQDNVIRIPINKSTKIKLAADTDIRNAKLTIFSYFLSV